MAGIRTTETEVRDVCAVLRASCIAMLFAT